MFRKILFTTLLISFNAQADWVKVASTLNDDAVFYVSKDSIKKTGTHTRSAWELVNNPNYSREGYLSAKVQQEYDCKSDKVRLLSASAHSELFGKGVTVTTAQERPLPWQEMPKGSVATFARDYICSQKVK